MPLMRAVQVSEPGGPFELVERPIPKPGPNQVRIRVEACGICHSDSVVKKGAFPGLQYPRVPGHEIVGSIQAVGLNVTSWQRGARVGVGWHGGHCGQCDRCRRGDFITCRRAAITGITFDGGYADHLLAPSEALARIPEGLDPVEAAPLLCAGLTPYNALRFSKARPGDVVAIQGVGGLGHLGIQYANRMGFYTVAISRGSAKWAYALELGSHRYIDAGSEDPVAILRSLGGARVLLATVPSTEAMSALIDGIGPDGELIVVGGGAVPVRVTPSQLLRERRGIRGWAGGSPASAEKAVYFNQLTGSTAHTESYPLDQAAAAYRRMIRNEARFRAVLTP